ncbi:MAG: alpha/beta hydrolase [Candidatus Obscuribacterales bacterium]|nr:alpha/beta hydrolase [Candidatus Obscuribacterales bacterium]
MLKLYPEWVFPDPHFDTKNIIAKLHGPMLIMHGEKDRLIPVHHGHELFALAQEPKELVLIPNAGHNDMLSADEKIFSDALTQFLSAEARSPK